MPRGGDRGGRRPKGALGKKNAMLRAVTEQALTSGILPLEVLLNNMRFYYEKADLAEQVLAQAIANGEPTPALLEKLKALCNFRGLSSENASLAAPYCHAKLASIEVHDKTKDTLVMIEEGMTEDQAAIAWSGMRDGSDAKVIN